MILSARPANSRDSKRQGLRVPELDSAEFDSATKEKEEEQQTTTTPAAAPVAKSSSERCPTTTVVDPRLICVLGVVT